MRMLLMMFQVGGLEGEEKMIMMMLMKMLQHYEPDNEDNSC